MPAGVDLPTAGLDSNPEPALVFSRTLIQRLRHMNAMMVTMDPRKRTMREVFSARQRSAQAYETGSGPPLSKTNTTS